MAAIVNTFTAFGVALARGIPLLIETLIIIYIAKLIHDGLTKFDDNAELFKNDNRAVGVATAGYYLGILIALTGVLAGGSKGLLNDVIDVGVYGILAIVMQNISRWSADKFILSEFSIDEELVRDRNMGTAWAMFGIYFATGMIVRGAIMGDSASFWSGIGTTLYYFILSQVILVIVAWVYQSKITPYDFHEEIKNDNVAAGLAFAGFVSALGVIVSHGGGNHVSVADTVGFILWTAIGIVILGFTRAVLAERILVPGHKITDEVVRDRNENAGWMLIAAYHIMAWVFVLAV
jgi:uncharacterized membrane protein YjfL (UPF0719 family)